MTISTVRSHTDAETHTHTYTFCSVGFWCHDLALLQVASTPVDPLHCRQVGQNGAKWIHRSKVVFHLFFFQQNGWNRTYSRNCLDLWTGHKIHSRHGNIQLGMCIVGFGFRIIDLYIGRCKSPDDHITDLSCAILQNTWKKWKPSYFNDLTGKERYVRQIKLCFTSPFQGCFGRSQHNSRKHQRDIRRGNKR